MLAPTPQAERYPSRVEEINDHLMLLAMPMSKGVPVLPPPNGVFYGRLVAAGAAWLFTSRVRDKRAQPVPLWVCDPPGDFRKIQMRSYVRLETALPAEVRLAAGEDKEVRLAATTRDIGGGGLLLALPGPVAAGTALTVAVDLGEFGRLSVGARVVRAEYDDLRKICCVGVKFVDIPERDRDKIIKYIFKKQLERRQKGF